MRKWSVFRYRIPRTLLLLTEWSRCQPPHSTHKLTPVMLLYFPARHAVHTPFAPVYPALHRQPVIACPLSACPDFTGQL